MKKFRLTWYEGYLTEDPSDTDFIKEVLDVKEVECESIEYVNKLEILPEDEKKKYYHYAGGHGYVRCILCDDKNRLCDYGSHIKFIWVQEV